MGPWVRLAKELNLTIKYWKPTQIPGTSSPFAVGLNLSELEPLLSANTRLVAFTAGSNIMGHFTAVKEVVDLVKQKTGGRCMTMVDCVAYSAHGRMDMQEWGCDAVLFSFYKVCLGYAPHCSRFTDLTAMTVPQLFGPHISCLAVSPWSPLAGKSVHSLGHYFHPQSVAYKFAPGGASYELQVGCHAVLPYLISLGATTSNLPQSRQLDIAFERIQAHEKLLSERLLEYLLSDEAKAKGVRVIGPETAHNRTPTISFIVLAPLDSDGTTATYKKRLLSKDIVAVFDAGRKVRSRLPSHVKCPQLIGVPIPDRNQIWSLLFDQDSAMSSVGYEHAPSDPCFQQEQRMAT